MFTLACLAAVRYGLGLATRLQEYHFSISVDEGPSEPERDCCGDVATSKTLIDS